MSKKFIYMLLASLIIFSSFFALSNESSNKSLDNYAYCMALGFDKGENKKLKLSFQIPLNSSSAGSSNSGSEQSTSSIVNTVECESLDSGINLMNSYITQQINLSHCKAIIISEEFANEGVSDIIYTLMNKVEISSNCLIIISRGDSEEFLKKSVSSLESASARYYNSSIESSFSTGYTQKVTIDKFFSALKDDFEEPFASLSAINSENSQVNKDSSSDDSSNIAGETQNTGSSESSGDSSSSKESSEKPSNPENLGLAVFKNDRIIGELNGLETVCHLLTTGHLQSYNLTIPDPQNYKNTIDLHITLRNKPKIDVKIVNGSPFIDVKLELTARILSIDSNSDSNIITNELTLYEEACNYYLTKQMENYLYKTSKEFKSDIVGFGKYALSSFLTSEDWTAYNWLDNYENSFFNVSVDTNIKSGFLLMNS